MGSKRHTAEQIINKLRQAEVELANGATVAQVLVAQWRRHYDTARPHYRCPPQTLPVPMRYFGRATQPWAEV